MDVYNATSKKYIYFFDIALCTSIRIYVKVFYVFTIGIYANANLLFTSSKKIIEYAHLRDEVSEK